MELFIIRDGQQAGPFTEDDVRTLLTRGGLRHSDMGWRKGLPAWLPLSEVMNPSAQASSAPPPVNGLQSSARPRPASPRQKVLLQYLGVSFVEAVTREEAALAMSDALENPKHTGRLAKWGDEKLRLHPDLFQEELDYRRANRISRYIELCQTEGSEVVKDITKAHVQVLMESLDKRHPNWEQEPRAALWNYFLPSVAEHFPQLINSGWKGDLKMGGSSKVAAAYAGTSASGALSARPPTRPGALGAAMRGLIYGLLTLAVVIAGIYIFRDGARPDVTRNDAKPEVKSVAAPTVALPTAPSDPIHPTEAPLIAALPAEAAPANPAPVAVPPAPVATSPGAPTAVTTAPPVPEMTANPAAPVNATTAFTPAPLPPGVSPVAPPAGEPAPATPGAVPRTSAVLTQPVTVQLQFGKVTLNPGTRVRLIAIEGQNVRVNFNNNIVLVPVNATDLDPTNTVIAAAPATLPPSAPANAPTPPAPASPTASKPAPSSDL